MANVFIVSTCWGYSDDNYSSIEGVFDSEDKADAEITRLDELYSDDELLPANYLGAGAKEYPVN